MILAPSNMQNNKGGSGRYTPLKRKPQTAEELQADIDALNSLNDPRMRFKNSRDPVYIAFEYVQKQSIKRLAKDFVRDLVNDSISFISKATSGS